MQEAKRRRFQEALRKIYFPVPQPQPPCPSPPRPPQSPPQADPSSLLEENHPSEERDEEAGSADEAGTTQKLTRSQRKRLRKRKLKEAAVAVSSALPGRRKLIGPMLPAADSVPVHGQPECEGSRRNGL